MPTFWKKSMPWNQVVESSGLKLRLFMWADRLLLIIMTATIASYATLLWGGSKLGATLDAPTPKMAQSKTGIMPDLMFNIEVSQRLESGETLDPIFAAAREGQRHALMAYGLIQRPMQDLPLLTPAEAKSGLSLMFVLEKNEADQHRKAGRDDEARMHDLRAALLAEVALDQVNREARFGPALNYLGRLRCAKGPWSDPAC